MSPPIPLLLLLAAGGLGACGPLAAGSLQPVDRATLQPLAGGLLAGLLTDPLPLLGWM